jgi:carbamoyl-phosphate synthase large subunit
VVAARLMTVMVVAVAGFSLLQGFARRVETRATVALFDLTGSRRVFVASPTSIGVVPAGHPAFRAVVTPTCSSLSSLLAIGCLASLARGARRRTGALLTAGAVVAAGNVVRIAASILVGLFSGRSSLVLFHDWVGSAFAFAYTLGGYVLLLYLILPRRQADAEPSHVAHV